MRTRGDRLEPLGNGADGLATQHRPNGENLRLGERRQIGERALAHPRTFAIGLAQQVRGARITIRDNVNMHDYILDAIPAKSSKLHGYILQVMNLAKLLITLSLCPPNGVKRQRTSD
jgi:hypothetical protein